MSYSTIQQADYFTNRIGNSNILFAILIANKMPNMIVFGGTIRDLVRKVPSKDLDVIFPKDPSYAMTYNSEKRKFEDGFFEQLQSIFGSNVQKVDNTDTIVEETFERVEIAVRNRPSVPPKQKLSRSDIVVKNLDLYSESTSDDRELIFDEVLDENYDPRQINFDNISFYNDHAEYILNFCGIEFKLDVSFHDNIDDMSGFKPACAEDSLFIRFGDGAKSVRAPEIDPSVHPAQLLDQLSKFIFDNVQSSVLPSMKNKILQNCRTNVTTILNVDTPKRALKIARFLDEGSKLRTINSKRTIVVTLRDIRNKTNCSKEKMKISSLISYIESNSLSDPDSY